MVMRLIPAVRSSARGSFLLLFGKQGLVLLFLCGVFDAHAQTPVTLAEPALAGSLSFSSRPTTVDTGVFGTWYVDGVLSGLGLVQSSPGAGDRTALADISNGQLIVQKADGLVQFYVQAGAYAIPALGVRYGHVSDATDTWGNFYSPLPQAFLRIVPNTDFSIEAGKLPTLVGAEDTFDFEDVNIERGLLWNQTSSVSRGVQANATLGAVVLNVSVNDGYYSDRFTWLTGEATWTINSASTLVLNGGGNLGRSGTSSVATPLLQNNSDVFNLAYTYMTAAFSITPNLQYSHVSADEGIGIRSGGETYAAAVMANYKFPPRLQLAGRLEYIASGGGANLLYGAGSSAVSLTITPTVTFGRLFVRADASVVGVIGSHAGAAFGENGNAGSQVRGLLETGVIF